MPTLPLYDTTAHPDGWHHVVAPGGFERWQLEAEDLAHGIRLTVELVEGDQGSRAYRRAYRRYRRRPTRVPPPLPSDYPCVRVNVSENGRTLWDLDAPQRPGALQASTNVPGVALGPCELRVGDDGTIRLSIESAAPRPGHASFSGDLAFSLVADSNYEVVGTLREWNGAEVWRAVEFRGDGRCKHTIATEPIHF
jgi:hypothetical protein